MPQVNQQIVAVGGGGDTLPQTLALVHHVISLTGAERPRILCVPTASADSDERLVAFYELFSGLAELSHAKFFPWPPADLRERVLAQDALYVLGGSTANLLAIWRTHGFDAIVREAWESGVVLFGASAGMICWFEAGVTDSFGPQLEGMPDGLGFLAGSACPHYDAEELRRPRYRELVDSGFPAGIAADNGVGLHYVGRDLREVITCRPGATAYHVSREGERPLPARLISGA